MDMNWQAMLHEAAKTSFENDIEVLAAADNDAYSCVDLSQEKIRKLSEQILLLPHQGTVLLFSRYCFCLSPEETEMFFRLKNAKGCFRFYRNLLSSSMGLSADQIISETSFSQACKIALKEYLHTELKEDAGVYRAEKNRTHIAFRRIGRAVAVAVVTLTLLFSTYMVVNAQFREKVIAWVVETFEKYSIFELKSNGDNTQPDLQSYKPTYLPNKAELLNTIELPEFVNYKYEITNSDYFNIQISQSDIRIYVDAENADIKPLDKDGITGYFFKKHDLNYVCFERNGCFFSAYGSLDVDELIKIAIGITKK